MNTTRATIEPSDAGDNALIINHLQFLSIRDWPTRVRRRPTQAVDSSNSRATILLLDADDSHRNNLRVSLHNQGYDVLAYAPSYLTQFEDLNQPLRMVQLIIFDVTVTSRNLLQELIRVCRYRALDGLPVPVICPTRVDRGAAFEEHITSLEAQLLYE